MERKTKLVSFTQLKTWQQGHKLVILIYKLTGGFPKKEKFVLTSQMLRSAISITSNIAEGFTRLGKKEKRQFYYTSKASLTELQNQLIIARDVGYVNMSEFEQMAKQTILVHKLLNGLIKGIKNLS